MILASLSGPVSGDTGGQCPLPKMGKSAQSEEFTMPALVPSHFSEFWRRRVCGASNRA